MSLLDKASLIVTPNAVKESKLYSIVPSSGAGDMTVVRATTATRVNSAGLIEVVPRNLLTYSNDFPNAAWTKQNVTLTANSIANPTNGIVDAYRVNITSTGVTGLFQEIIKGAGNYTVSVFVKKAETQYVNLGFIYSAGIYSATQFDLNSGSINIVISSVYTDANSSITNIGDGWFKITHTANINTAEAYPLFGPSNAVWSSGEPRQTLTGNNTTGAYFFGMQAELFSTATEYFPTTTRLNIPRIDYTNGSCPSLLVEPQRTNLLTYSEQFDDASWTKTNATITANTTTSPSGISNADTLVITSGGYILKSLVSFSVVSGEAITLSIFLKSTTANFLLFGGATPAGTDVYTIETYPNGWYRHKLTRTFSVTTVGTIQCILGYDIIGTHFIWGAEVEQGSYATSYIPTVASSVTRNADVISKTGISSLIGQTEGVLFLDFVYTQLESNGLIPITLGTNSSNHVYFYIEGNERINFDFVVGGIDVLNIQTATGFAVKGTRYKIALAYKANDFAAYINGVLIGTQNTGAITGFNDFNFGYPYASGYSYPNKVNSSALWKTRLTNAELSELTTL